MELYCQVTPQGLVPMYDSDLDCKKQLKNGTVVKCKVTVPRNYEHHKKFFALVRLTYTNLPESLAEYWNIHDEAGMLKRFKRDLGYYDAVVNEFGEREIEYRSISFASMDQSEFQQFYDQAVNLVLHSYIPGLEREDLTEEIINFK